MIEQKMSSKPMNEITSKGYVSLRMTLPVMFLFRKENPLIRAMIANVLVVFFVLRKFSFFFIGFDRCLNLNIFLYYEYGVK